FGIQVETLVKPRLDDRARGRWRSCMLPPRKPVRGSCARSPSRGLAATPATVSGVEDPRGLHSDPIVSQGWFPRPRLQTIWPGRLTGPGPRNMLCWRVAPAWRAGSASIGSLTTRHLFSRGFPCAAYQSGCASAFHADLARRRTKPKCATEPNVEDL